MGKSWSQDVASAAKTLGTLPQWPDIVAGHTVSHPLHAQGQESGTGLSSLVHLADPYLDKAQLPLLPGEHPLSHLSQTAQRLEAETEGFERREQVSDFILQATGSRTGSKVAWSDLSFSRLLWEKCSWGQVAQ